MANTWRSIISTAKRLNRPRSLRQARWLLAIACWLLLPSHLPVALACPFCTALKPALSQLRQRAAIVALGEIERTSAGTTSVRIRRFHSGRDRQAEGAQTPIPLDKSLLPGTLVLLFGSGSDNAITDWQVIPVDETSYSYFVRSPKEDVPAADRLRYFTRFLEHPNALVGEDAYLEFAHAPFDQVAAAADVFDMARVRSWLASEAVTPEHKGFYGLVLGLASEDSVRGENARCLLERIDAEDDDFRAGFDGVLAGYLLLDGIQALDHIEQRYLKNPRAADGDVRHVLNALRFYQEFGRVIPRERQQQALASLLARPEFAATVIVDLARLQDWTRVEQIRSLYGREGFNTPAIRATIVGYLQTCPLPAAANALAALRQQDPQGVAAAVEALSRAGGLSQRE